jgi:glycosyltransferase involved in cell wall biosynthesis
MVDISVSAVIPTRNRPASLHRALSALTRQERPPDEVIVSDASDLPLDANALAAAYPGLRLTYFPAVPSVCAQRNEGIRRPEVRMFCSWMMTLKFPPITSGGWCAQ